MSDELFPVESITADSPRLAWKKRHRIATYHSLPNDPSCSCWFAGFWDFADDFTEERAAQANEDPTGEVLFLYEHGLNGYWRTGTGKTEDEALAKFCEMMRLKLWNEEAAP
jgi:hypothetical protein